MMVGIEVAGSALMLGLLGGYCIRFWQELLSTEKKEE